LAGLNTLDYIANLAYFLFTIEGGHKGEDRGAVLPDAILRGYVRLGGDDDDFKVKILDSIEFTNHLVNIAPSVPPKRDLHGFDASISLWKTFIIIDVM
jgi:hypothetical protein